MSSTVAMKVFEGKDMRSGTKGKRPRAYRSLAARHRCGAAFTLPIDTWIFFQPAEQVF
jgi:hypothetical protein